MNQEVFYKSPIGSIQITGNEEGIVSLFFLEEPIPTSIKIPLSLEKCVLQLDEYFNGKRTHFNLKLKFIGTEFQNSVWQEL